MSAEPVPTAPPRRGRVAVGALLVLFVVALVGGIYSLSTEPPARDRIEIDGVNDSQRIFGGVRQAGDRLGDSDAPVTIQFFDDLQCGNCADQFDETIPTIVDKLVRPGKVQLLLRHYSFSSSDVEFGAYGAEAAADQGYGWQYTFLFLRNVEEAKKFNVNDQFQESLASSIPELDVPEWQAFLTAESGPEGEIYKQLQDWNALGTGLGLRAQPSAIVSGPNGPQTVTLQDSPSLDQILEAVDQVG